MKKLIIKIQIVLLLLTVISVQGQILKQGSIVATHRTGYIATPTSNSAVVQILDANNTSGIPPTTTSPMFSATIPNKYVWTTGLGRPNWIQGIGTNYWDYNTLGAVFGITLDYVGNGNIYTANTSIYSGESVTKHDAVYKINGTTGAVNQIINLSGTDPTKGIGNLKYFINAGNNYIVLTWWEDGKIYIYRETTPGTWVQHSSFAPKFGNTSTNINIIPYGVAVRNTPAGLSVFYGEFNLNVYAPATFRVFSIPLSASATFLSTETLELTAPVDYLPVSNGDKSPISDISFSTDNSKILLAQQTLHGTDQIGAHRSRIHEYINIGSVWSQVGTFPSGYNSGVSYSGFPTATPALSSFNVSCNSAGGVTYFNNILFKDGSQVTNLKCDTSILYTSDWIYFGENAGLILGPLQPSELTTNFGGIAPNIYGIQGLPSKNTFASDLDAFSFSLKISEFANSVGYDKQNLGDVEAYNPPLNCSVSCQCGAWDSISLNNQGHWWILPTVGSSSPIPTLSFNQDAVTGVLIPHYHCTGSNCNATYTYSIASHGTVTTLTGSSSGALDLNQPALSSLPCGHYSLCITPHCGSTDCPPQCMPFEIICLPLCACKGNVTVNGNPQSLVVTTQNNTSTANPVSLVSGSFTLTSTTPVTEVRMLVDEFRIITKTGNENCRLCKNKPQTWGSINAASLSGVALQTFITPTLTNDILEFIFNNGPNTVFNLSNNTLNFTIALPGVTGLDCCNLQIEMCVKIIVRDNNCCETEVLKCGVFNLK